MPNAAEVLRAQLGDEPTTTPTRPKRATVAQSDGPYTRANAVDTIALLDQLGIEHWATDRGEFFVCPGCGERDSMIGDTGGGKCFHDRCSHVGVGDKRGFRTNVALVEAVKDLKPLEAAKWICEAFGVDQKPKAKEHADPMQGDTHEHTDADAPNATPPAGAGQKPPTEWVVALPEQIFAPLAEPDYLIAGLIRRGGLLEIQAYGGSGKSWIAVNLALCLASGLRFLGRFGIKQSTVACLDYENGFYEMARRLQANAKALGLSTPVQGIGLITMPDMYMTSDGFEAAVTKLAATYQVIIIDTLKAASPGVDENDSKMRESLDRLRRVGERTGCTFVVLIHSKKKSNSSTEIDARERGRGSSAIYDAADAQLGVEYEQGKPLQIVQTKARSGRYIEPFQVTIEDGENGAVHVVASDSAKSEQDGSSADRFEAACARVLEAVRAWPGSSQIVLREKLGIRNGTVTAALQRLQSDGAIRNTGTDGKPKWFPTSIGGRLD